MAFGSGAVVNVGTIQAYGGSTAPDGWLICDGSAISRTLYADLFDVIGETYGAGDGSTTFNLPNGKMPLGLTMQIIGNGVTIGMTNGTTDYGIQGGGGYMYGKTTLYGTTVGTTGESGSNINGKLGLTLDGTKSGMIADLATASAASTAIIKY